MFSEHLTANEMIKVNHLKSVRAGNAIDHNYYRQELIRSPFSPLSDDRVDHSDDEDKAGNTMHSRATSAK